MAGRPVRPDAKGDIGTPRWVKMSGIIAGLAVLLFVVAVITGIGGPHGPGRHMPSGSAGTPPASAIGDPAPSAGSAGGHTSP